MDVGIELSVASLVAPPAVRWIVRTLEEAGFETWAVGGAVRDALLGVGHGDWDLATRARPKDVRRVFTRTVPLGIEHGTVGVLARDGVLYEVTTFRRDVETSGRHAVVAFADSLDEDLSRRDFTVNSIAWHPLRGAIYDPHEGIRDLAGGRLRTVGDPNRRFAEDYLRVLRALRFAGRYSLVISQKTWISLKSSVSGLDVLSRERVRDEIVKVLDADPRPRRALELYRASGALEVVAPELAASERALIPEDGLELDAWRYGLTAAEALSPRRPLLRLAVLLQGVGLPQGADAALDDSDRLASHRHPGRDDARRELRSRWRSGLAARRSAGLMIRLRFSNAHTDEVVSLVDAGPVPPPADGPVSGLRRWLSDVGPERFPALTRTWVARARVLAPLGKDVSHEVTAAWRTLRAELRQAPPLRLADLAIDGEDLIRMGYRPGPRFGEVLQKLLDRVLDDPGLNQLETLGELAKEILATERQGKSNHPDGGRGP